MRIRCRCGQLLAVPQTRTAPRMRCPSCGTVSRVPGAQSAAAPKAEAAPPDPPAAQDQLAARVPAVAPPAPPPTEPEFDEEYILKDEPEIQRPAQFVPVHTSTVYSPTPAKRRARDSDDDEDRPFLSGAAVLYPWLYPNCLYWLWLSILSSLCMGCIALTLFVMGFLPLRLASMLMVCVALTGYILAAFELIIEQTAHGEDHMQGLPELGWGEILPPFFRAFGAMCAAIAVPVGISYLIGRLLPIPVILMILPGAVFSYLLFPVFLITNLIDETFIPIKSVLDVIGRVMKRGGCFILFLVLIGWLSVVLAGGVILIFYFSIIAGLFALGPAATTWLMYYGHLLGRLGEKLMNLPD